MNEEDSTFFVTIENYNMKSQNINFKNIKSNYFYRPIKSKRKKMPDINHKHSPSFPNNDLTNSMLNENNIPPKLNKINNISKINNIQSYMKNEIKPKSFILGNDNNINKSQNSNTNLEENIDIDDDIDEYSDVKFNININKPKLPFNSKNYYNNINKNKLSYSVSRNINNIFNKTLKTKTEILKNSEHNKCKFNKNKSCSSINNDLSKLRLHQKISVAESKIDMLRNLIKRRNIQILSLQLLFEKINAQHKFKKYNRNFEKKMDEMNKQIFNLKLKLSKCEEDYINKKKLEKEINNEKLLYSIKKAEMIEKILERRMHIINKNKKKDFNSNNNYIEESTINNNNDSLFLESEYNILETKENMNITEINNNKINNKFSLKGKDNDNMNNKNIINNEINCFKNKKFSDYFAQRFIIETNYNKNNNHQKTNNSKFNIFINTKKEK